MPRTEYVDKMVAVHYSEIKHDCGNVINTLWQLIGAITDKKEITISYYKVDRTLSDKLRRIQFWYTGPSLQAILDRLPTAKIIERKPGAYLLEAEIYGDGIKMFLLSQGASVKVVAPDEFVEEIVEAARGGVWGCMHPLFPPLYTK